MNLTLVRHNKHNKKPKLYGIEEANYNVSAQEGEMGVYPIIIIVVIYNSDNINN